MELNKKEILFKIQYKYCDLYSGRKIDGKYKALISY